MRTFLLYLAAGIVFTGIGIWNQNFIYSYFEGLAFVCLAVVGVPYLVRRLRRRGL